MTGVTLDTLQGFLREPPPRESYAAIHRALPASGTCGLLRGGMAFLLLSIPFLLLFFPWRIGDALRMSLSTPMTVQGRVTDAPDSLMIVKGVEVFYTRFVFEVDGTHHSGHSHSVGTRFAVGEQVPVEYLPDAPHIARIAGTTLLPKWHGVFVSIIPLIACVGMVVGARGWYRRRYLLRMGVFAAGHVCSVEPTGMKVRDLPEYRITVGFRIPRGEERITNAYLLDPDDVRRARRRQETGEWVGILYDPVCPKHSILVDSLVIKKDRPPEPDEPDIPEDPDAPDDLDDANDVDDCRKACAESEADHEPA